MRTRSKRLAENSTRDLEWQRQAYAEVMGEERALEQELAGRIEQGKCTCRRARGGFGGQTLKMKGQFFTVHEQGCPRWKPVHEEWREEARKFYGRS